MTSSKTWIWWKHCFIPRPAESAPPRLDLWCAVTRTNAIKSLSDEVVFSLSGSKCTVSARFLHGFKTCKGCKSLQNRTKGAETRSSKPAKYRTEITLKRNFQKLRESPGVRYESVGRGFESLPSHQEKPVHAVYWFFFLSARWKGFEQGGSAQRRKQSAQWAVA